MTTPTRDVPKEEPMSAVQDVLDVMHEVYGKDDDDKPALDIAIDMMNNKDIMGKIEALSGGDPSVLLNFMTEAMSLNKTQPDTQD